MFLPYITTMHRSDISRDFGSRLFVTNRKRWNRAVERIAAVGIFLFFPGFLMYHLLIAATPLGPFLWAFRTQFRVVCDFAAPILLEMEEK